MGTPLTPNESALLCTACFGPGKPFGDGPSPLVVQARFTSFIDGAEAETDQDQLLYTTHYLEQTIAPCIYRINDGHSTWILQWFGGFTEFSIQRNSDGKYSFWHELDQGCGVDLDNELVSPGGNAAYNGSINLTWDLEGID